MARYYISGRGLYDANETVGCLWNPHADIPLRVFYVGLGMRESGISRNYRLNVVTVRGTPASTLTPDMDNDVAHRDAPPSGAVLDLGNYSVDSGEATPYLARMRLGPVQGSGWEWHALSRGGIIVLPGTGLGVTNESGPATSGDDVTFGWEE